MSQIARRLFLGGFGAMIFAPSLSAISTSSAEAFAKRALDDLQVLVNAAPSNQKSAAFFRKYSDVPTIARAVVGAPWRGMTDAQQAAYTEAFESYVVRKYTRLFGEVKGARIEMLGSTGGGSAGVKVNAQFLYDGYDPYKVQFHVVDGAKGPVILDLKILGISLISTERANVRRWLGSGGNDVDNLIKRLNAA